MSRNKLVLQCKHCWAGGATFHNQMDQFPITHPSPTEVLSCFFVAWFVFIFKGITLTLDWLKGSWEYSKLSSIYCHYTCLNQLLDGWNHLWNLSAHRSEQKYHFPLSKAWLLTRLWWMGGNWNGSVKGIFLKVDLSIRPPAVYSEGLEGSPIWQTSVLLQFTSHLPHNGARHPIPRPIR